MTVTHANSSQKLREQTKILLRIYIDQIRLPFFVFGKAHRPPTIFALGSDDGEKINGKRS